MFFVGTKLNVADGAVDDNVDGPSDGKKVNPVDGLILGASTKKYDGSYEAGTFGTNEGIVDGPSDGKRVNPVDGLILGASTKKYDGSNEAGTFGTNKGNVALLYDGENTFDGY